MSIKGTNESSQRTPEIRRLSHDAVEAIPQRLQKEHGAAKYMQRCILNMYPIPSQAMGSSEYLPPNMIKLVNALDVSAMQTNNVAETPAAGGYSQYSTPEIAAFFKELEIGEGQSDA